MKILVTGDSHTAALKLGADRLQAERAIPARVNIDVQQLGGGMSLTESFFIDKGDHAEMIRDEHQRRIKRLPVANDQEQYDYYGICGPLHTIRLWRNKEYWQKFTPFAPHGDKAPVSAGLLRYVIEQDQRYILQLVELLKRVGVGVFVVEPPKPYRHHSILELVDDDVIMYLDKYYRNTIRKKLVAWQVPIVDVPAACYDADGFMLERYRHDNPEDHYHGNVEFGALMINEIVGFVKASTD